MADDTPRLRSIDLLLTGAAFGLASGFAEGAIRLLRQAIESPAMPLTAYFAWMPAAANLVALLLIAVLLAVVTRLLPGRLGTPLALGTLTGLAAWDVVAIYTPPLHPYAVILIAIGVAVQLVRLILGRREGFLRLARIGTAVLLVLLLGIAGGIEGWRALQERRALGAQPAAGRDRPNIVLLVLDTVRSLDLSVYGYFRRTTPALERLAQRGVVFDRAIATAPWTLPAHASMFTGRWLHEQSTGWKDPLDATFPTLAEVLTAQGYASGGFVANLGFCDRKYGLARGFAHYEDHPLNWRTTLQGSNIGRWLIGRRFMIRIFGHPSMWTRKSATSVTDDFLQWSGSQGNRPYFAFLNFIDAHHRYYWTQPFNTLFRTDSALAPAAPRHIRELPDGFNAKPPSIAEYDRSITYIDSELDRLFRELERRGTLDRTLVIVTSDHGEEFFEHGLIGHGNGLYHPSLSVPLILALPGKVPANQRVPQVVSMRDLPATILDLTGGDHARFPGRSLARTWQPSPAAGAVPDTVLAEVGWVWHRPAWYPASKGSMKSLYTDSLHLIFNGDSTYELYNLTHDPWEQQNLAVEPAAAAELTRLRALLDGVPLAPRSTHSPRAQDADP